MELDGIFLDLYGTLTAGDRAAVEAVCHDVVRDTGVSITPHELSITWGERFFHFLDFCNQDQFKTLFEVERQTLLDTMSMLGVTLDPAPYCLKLQRYWQDAPLQADVAAFFEQVKYPICIVSNADDADAHAVIRRHNLPVDFIITSEAARSYKPHPAIFEAALARTGWRRDRVIHAGDSLHSDIGGAIVCGIRNAWINRVGRIHDVGTHTPDYEFPNLQAMLEAKW